ncbi:hypothetical protein GCM10009777_34190 [Microbacterium pumilum]|uniref:Uncharacterized protein n=1 Tax=Microbacterium pumilum TaxID=344165 RepID=A0ABN2SZR5_9MICO
MPASVPSLPSGLWDETRVAALLASHDHVIVSGTVENQGRFYEAFDHIVLLSAPTEVLMRRVSERTNNPYGGSVDQQAEVRRYIEQVEPLLRAGATIEVDGRRPVIDLADRALNDPLATDLALLPGARPSALCRKSLTYRAECLQQRDCFNRCEQRRQRGPAPKSAHRLDDDRSP